jgi:hypothetical protein
MKEPRLNRRGYVAAAVTRWPDHVWIIMGTLRNIVGPEISHLRGIRLSPLRT